MALTVRISVEASASPDGAPNEFDRAFPASDTVSGILTELRAGGAVHADAVNLHIDTGDHVRPVGAAEAALTLAELDAARRRPRMLQIRIQRHGLPAPGLTPVFATAMPAAGRVRGTPPLEPGQAAPRWLDGGLEPRPPTENARWGAAISQSAAWMPGAVLVEPAGAVAPAMLRTEGGTTYMPTKDLTPEVTPDGRTALSGGGRIFLGLKLEPDASGGVAERSGADAVILKTTPESLLRRPRISEDGLEEVRVCQYLKGDGPALRPGLVLPYGMLASPAAPGAYPPAGTHVPTATVVAPQAGGGDLFDAVVAIKADGARMAGAPAMPRRLNPFALRDLAADTLAGVRHLRSHGIVHRDISPENIVLSVPVPERALTETARMVLDNLGAPSGVRQPVADLTMALALGDHRGDVDADPYAPFGCVTAALETALRTPVVAPGAAAPTADAELSAARAAGIAAAVTAVGSIAAGPSRAKRAAEASGSNETAVTWQSVAAAAAVAARVAVAERLRRAEWGGAPAEAAAAGAGRPQAAAAPGPAAEAPAFPAAKAADEPCPELQGALCGAAAEACRERLHAMVRAVEGLPEGGEAALLAYVDAGVAVAQQATDLTFEAAAWVSASKVVRPGLRQKEAVPTVAAERAAEASAVVGRGGMVLPTTSAVVAGTAAAAACAARLRFRLIDLGMACDAWTRRQEFAMPASAMAVGKASFVDLEVFERRPFREDVDEYSVGRSLLFTQDPRTKSVPSMQAWRDGIAGQQARDMATTVEAHGEAWHKRFVCERGGMMDVIAGLTAPRSGKAMPVGMQDMGPRWSDAGGRLDCFSAMLHPALAGRDPIDGDGPAHGAAADRATERIGLADANRCKQAAAAVGAGMAAVASAAEAAAAAGGDPVAAASGKVAAMHPDVAAAIRDQGPVASRLGGGASGVVFLGHVRAQRDLTMAAQEAAETKRMR